VGGPGSGRWNDVRTRGRVERCLAISAPRTRRNPGVLGRGRWTWPRTNFAVEYLVRGGSVLMLAFWSGESRRRQEVALAFTVPNYGGRRVWFLCPECGRRVGRLYLPERAKLFACRGCHHLAYESAQASRAGYYEVFKSQARRTGGTSRWARELFREAWGGGLVADRLGRLEVGRNSRRPRGSLAV
jgi:hypothetical protein